MAFAECSDGVDPPEPACTGVRRDIMLLEGRSVGIPDGPGRTCIGIRFSGCSRSLSPLLGLVPRNFHLTANLPFSCGMLLSSWIVRLTANVALLVGFSTRCRNLLPRAFELDWGSAVPGATLGGGGTGVAVPLRIDGARDPPGRRSDELAMTAATGAWREEEGVHFM